MYLEVGQVILECFTAVFRHVIRAVPPQQSRVYFARNILSVCQLQDSSACYNYSWFGTEFAKIISDTSRYAGEVQFEGSP